jgi:hypothetical protein
VSDHLGDLIGFSALAALAGCTAVGAGPHLAVACALFVAAASMFRSRVGLSLMLARVPEERVLSTVFLEYPQYRG